MDIICRAADRRKPRVDEVSGMVLSGGSFEGTWDYNLESAGNIEGDPIVNSEVTGVGNKLGISDSKVPGITIRAIDISKLGGNEGSGTV